MIRRRELITETSPNLTKDQIDQRLKMLKIALKLLILLSIKPEQKRIKLGLDLQGGMRVVLEVNTAKLLKKLVNNPDDAFKAGNGRS